MIIHKSITKYFACAAILYLCGCSTTQNLKPSDYLLSDIEVYINEEPLRDDRAEETLQQTPNETLFGLPVGLLIYNSADLNHSANFTSWAADSTSGFVSLLEEMFSPRVFTRLKYWYSEFWNESLTSIGEPPVLYSDGKNEFSKLRLKNYFISQGYLDCEVEDEVIFEDKKATIKYYVTLNPAPYTIEKYSYQFDNPDFETLYASSTEENYIKLGEPLVANHLSDERKRLIRTFKNHGYYYFNPNSIRFVVDTSRSERIAHVRLQVERDSTNSSDDTEQIYSISQVNIHLSDASLESSPDTLSSEGYIYEFGQYRVKPQILNKYILIEKDSLYNEKKRLNTFQNIGLLNSYKFSAIDFEPDTSSDNRLKMNLRLQPNDKYSFSTELNGLHSNSRYSISLNTVLDIRNVFGGLEDLSISFRGRLGDLQSVIEQTLPRFFNASELSVQTKLSFPSFLFLPIYRKITPDFLPRTELSASFSNQINIGLDRRFVQFSYTYRWNSNYLHSHRVTLFDIEFSNVLNPENYFVLFPTERQIQDNLTSLYQQENPDILMSLPTQDLINVIKNDKDFINKNNENKNAFLNYQDLEDRFARNTLDYITSALSYEYIYSDQRESNYKTYVRAFGELSGIYFTALNAISELERDDNDALTLFNTEFPEFIKTELDLRFYFNVTSNNQIATRFFGGIILPYGNSNNVPFQKLYFAGGANDLRGWQAYQLGPGANSDELSSTIQTDFIKLLLSVEYRFPILGSLEGSLFSDMGNIWGINNRVSETNFNVQNFLSEVAVDAGVGLRYNLSVLVIRTDLAYQLYDPSLPKADRWRPGDFRLGDSNLIFAIGYPF